MFESFNIACNEVRGKIYLPEISSDSYNNKRKYNADGSVNKNVISATPDGYNDSDDYNNCYKNPYNSCGQPSENATTHIRGGLIICHGIPSGEGGAPRSQGYEQLAQLFAEQGLATVIFNFSGTGVSGGNLDLRNWVEDLQKIIDYYFDHFGYTPLLTIGFSAGAAVSVEVAAGDERVTALALGACPADFSFFWEHYTEEQLWQWCHQLNFFRSPEKLPSREEWVQRFLSLRPREHIHLLAPRPHLIIHGEEDDLVLLSHAHTLYSLAGAGKRLATFPHIGHQLRTSHQIQKTHQSWVEEVLG